MEDKFISKINEYKTKAQGDIYNGYTVKEELYEFMRVKLFEDKMSVMLPIVFTEMDDAFKRKKYPNENRPQVIKTSYDGSVNFTFSLYDIDMNEKMLDPVKREIMGALRKVQPSTMFFDSGEVSIGKSKISWFDFKSFALDDTLYNFTAIGMIGGKYLHCMFNCRFKDMELWKEAMIQVAKSIIDETEGNE